MYEREGWIVGETWGNTEMRVKAELTGWAGLGTGARARTGNRMGTGARLAVEPWA